MLLSAFKQSHADISQSYPRMIRKSKVTATLSMNLSDLNHYRSFFVAQLSSPVWTRFRPCLVTVKVSGTQFLFRAFQSDMVF